MLRSAEQPAEGGDFHLATSGDLSLAVDSARPASGVAQWIDATVSARGRGRLAGPADVMTREHVAIAASGSGVRLWLPDGSTHMLTLREAADLAALLHEVTESP